MSDTGNKKGLPAENTPTIVFVDGKRYPITARQEAFAVLISSGTETKEAARKLGYAEGYGNNLARHPAVAKLAYDLASNHLRSTAFPRAVRFLEELVSNDQKDDKLRLRAAKEIMTAVQISQKQEQETGKDDKPVSEMSLHELNQFIHEKEREIKKARGVKEVSAPDSAPSRPQAPENTVD